MRWLTRIRKRLKYLYIQWEWDCFQIFGLNYLEVREEWFRARLNTEEAKHLKKRMDILLNLQKSAARALGMSEHNVGLPISLGPNGKLLPVPEWIKAKHDL